jgi:hypothetical protein
VKEALVIAPRSLLRSRLTAWLTQQGTRAGVNLFFENVNDLCERGEFHQRMRSFSDVMLWNVKIPPSWINKENQNVLWMDNCLINQKRGMFIDRRGLFAESNLSRDRGAKNKWNAEFCAQRDFGWKAFYEGSDDGPILVCLQRPKDSSVTWGFLADQREVNRTAEFLRLLKQHLPVDPSRVIIRQHPKERSFDLPLEVLDKEWRWECEAPFNEAVRVARGVVTINSTCAHEAVLAGVPVATIGSGTFTGWEVTLECADRPERLRKFLEWRVDPATARHYLGQAMTRHFLPYHITPEDPRHQATEFHQWLHSCQNAA